MANQVGKRYICEACDTQIMCVKPGAGSFSCCGAEMVLESAKPLPSSD